MISLSARLRAFDGALPGVTPVRYLVVLGIMTLGSIEVSERYASYREGMSAVLWLVLPGMLFALLGLLLARSAEQRGPSRFALHRAARLLPPLVMSLVLTILVTGSLFAAQRLDRFLIAPDTIAYLGNAVGRTSVSLGSVFEFNNASGIVNGLLWMVPVALGGCMLAWVVALLPRRAVSGSLAVVLAVIVAVAIATDFGWIDAVTLPRPVRPLVGAAGLAAETGLVAGMLGWRHRRRVPIDGVPFLLALLVIAIVSVVLRGAVEDRTAAAPVVGLAAAYLAGYLASLRWPFARKIVRINLAYGLLLYTFPVQQALVALLGAGLAWPIILLVSLPIAAALAAASWFAIERPLGGRRAVALQAASLSGPAGAERSLRWYAYKAREGATVMLWSSVLGGAMFVALLLAMFAMGHSS